MEARVVGGRFRILSEHAQGGAGTIYKALDLRSEQHVGLKMMRGLGAIDEARFAREARVLSQIEDPGLVRYLGHGVEGGLPYLAMEWLDGEDLRQRLLREGLTPAATLVLGQRVARVLAVLHLHGLVHRDIKPGNVFLVGGRVEEAKVLDLGLVRGGREASALTHTGLAVGTPGYMAPEQARGQRDVDARADVFALGCVLYRCLSGKAPFEGTHLVEIMTKVLLEEPESLRKLCPAAPPDLVALVHRMLAKEPETRPRSGAEVVAALAAVDMDPSAAGALSAPVSRRGVSITTQERRLASVLLVGPEGDRPAEDTFDGFAVRDVPSAIDGVLRTYGASIEHLAGDIAVVHLTGGARPEDEVGRAARCALSIRAALPRAPIAFATGLSEQSGKAPVGDAIERATGMLSQEQEALSRALAAGQPCPAWIAVDSVTASLLGGSFDVREADGAFRLHGTWDDSGQARTLLGKQTPMVGRDWEIGTITGAFRACVEEPGPRAVLVTGPVGAGKSRLAREVRSALSSEAPDVQIWSAACAAATAGSSLSLLADLLSSALSLRGAGPDAHERLLAAVSERLPPDKAPPAAEIFGEVLGIKLSTPSPALRAARSDPRIFAERTREAFEDLLSASAARGPVVLLLEDLHWGDAPTTRILGDVLGGLRDTPWMVLAFARPDVGSLFPSLWQEHDCQHIRLRPLTKKASEQIVRHVLGPEADRAAVSRIVAQADGNAFFLEELVRAFAARDVAGAQARAETALAVVQARLSHLDSEARRVLRAASVLGEVFWPSAVEALLGSDPSWSASLWVEALVSQEILVRRPHSRFEGEVELAFRHSLLRDGAYAMLTEGDRALGHRIAGEWLLEHGEPDPLVLAKHFDKGGAPDRAARCHLEAARRAVAGMDLTAAMERARHARMLSVSIDPGGASAAASELRRDCDLVLAEACLWRSEWAEVASHSNEVISASRPGTEPWIRALAFKESADFSLGDFAGLMQSIVALTSVEPEPTARPAAIQALGVALLVLGLGVQLPMARALAPRLEAMVSAVPERHLVPLGWASTGRGIVAAWGDGDPWAAVQHLNAGCHCFDEAGDRQNAGFLRGMLGTVYLEMMGAVERAEEELSRVPAGEDPASLVGAIRDDLVVLLALARGDDDAVRLSVAARLAAAEGGGIMAHMRAARGHAFLGEIAERAGDLALAAEELTTATAALRMVTPTLWPATAARLARVELARGHLSRAEETIRDVLASLSTNEVHGLGAPLAHLVYAEILLARGAREEARVVLGRSRDRLLSMAERVADEALRTAYLQSVPAHARTLSLAAENKNPL